MYVRPNLLACAMTSTRSSDALENAFLFRIMPIASDVRNIAHVMTCPMFGAVISAFITHATFYRCCMEEHSWAVNLKVQLPYETETQASMVRRVIAGQRRRTKRTVRPTHHLRAYLRTKAHQGTPRHTKAHQGTARHGRHSSVTG